MFLQPSSLPESPPRSPEIASAPSRSTNCLPRPRSSRREFKDLTLAYAVEDPKFIGSEYEVIYTDRTEVDFESNGEWSSVERKYAAVPAAIVPVQIADYVKKSFAGESIRKIDRDELLQVLVRRYLGQ